MVFTYQRRHNPLYASFLRIIGYNDLSPQTVEDIPFMPISLFKHRQIKSGSWPTERIFLSSGTTQLTRSRHHIRSLDHYLKIATSIWETTFGELQDYTFISLLPNYHENPSSSLLAMVSFFMREGKGGKEAYFIDNFAALAKTIDDLLSEGEQVVLFGVSFALLEYIQTYRHTRAHGMIVVETGGMKRFAKEITRFELHQKLQEGFDKAQITSEYGMTECQSQLYSLSDGVFEANAYMSWVLKDPYDPVQTVSPGQRGRICLIDLANVDTLSFIATDDLGMERGAEGLEVLGRLDHSDLRGCNYLIS